MPRRLLILGSTGSIGTQALDVVARAEGELEVVGLSAASSSDTLVAQARELGVGRIALADADAAARAAEAWTDGEVLVGAEGLVRLVVESEADLVLNALVGSAGLGPTVAALGEGIDLALANKESLVVGGELVTQLSEATGAQIIPVDSEHSAIHQLLAGERAGTVDKLVLTASGGPFRGRTAQELRDVTVEQALAHLGYPDMRVPIAYALHHPDRVELPVEPLDLAKLGQLTFEQPDTDTFGCLRLARAAGEAGGTAPCILNAANEVAVHAFLNGRLRFHEIAEVIAHALDAVPAGRIHAFQTLYAADRDARAAAAELVEQAEARSA
jgi:1-deoxy-D-xylulose-5-phosphate reductoisomerase